MTFTPLILICLAGQAPYECTPYTALDVVRGEPAQNEVTCALYAQEQLARTALVREGTWLKIGCMRENAHSS